jgi:UDPglucose 6-dehydrogenase
MDVTIFGSGYVGLVTGACLAEVGNRVLCVDIDPAKIDLLNKGGIPIFEPGLEALVARNRASGRLTFSTDPAEGVAHGLFQFIAVGTPTRRGRLRRPAPRPGGRPLHWRTHGRLSDHRR